jgi:glycosyltransferase involved in cell wall biosynthesis
LVPTLSVVVPIHNEEPSILRLYDRLTEVLERVRRPYEIIFVDDGSTDHSFDLLTNLLETDHHLKLIRLRRAFGQAAALAAGFDESQGGVVISLDGDVQHAPDDIPALLEKIDEGYDIVSGWRRPGQDNPRIANWLMAKVFKVKLHNFGTFNAYRAEVLKEINLFGDLHRFILALASFYGARIAEVPIHSSPRSGSRYRTGGTFQMLFDVVTIWFLLSLPWGSIRSGTVQRTHFNMAR